MFRIDFFSMSDVAIRQLAVENLNHDLEDWEKHIWRFIAQLLNPSVHEISIFTSGSTGTPKQIKHSKESIFNSARMTCEALDLKPGSTTLLCLPSNKIGGMMVIARCMVNRMTLYGVKPSSNPLRNLSPDVKIDFASFTPMQFHEILSNMDTAKIAAGISKILLGGQSTSIELEQSVQKMTNDICLTFGMTETISHIALKKLNGKNPGRYYTLLPGIKINTDERGCMIIDAPELGCSNVASNDIIRIISNNQFEWLGRWDNVINTGGIKIFPEMIEQKILPFIKPEFFISAVPDSKLGQKLVIVIESENLDEVEIIELTSVLEKLDKIHRPKEILFCSNFIRTDNGKINRPESLNKSHKRAPL